MRWDTDTIEYVIITIAFGAVGGAISGAFFADKLANKRDRRRRKVELISYLKAWDADIEANRTRYCPAANLNIGPIQLFDEKRLEMVAKAAAIELDYQWPPKRNKFKSLADAVATTEPDQIKSAQGHMTFRNAIANLVKCLEEQPAAFCSEEENKDGK
jgi:hypothetical protein